MKIIARTMALVATGFVVIGAGIWLLIAILASTNVGGLNVSVPVDMLVYNIIGSSIVGVITLLFFIFETVYLGKLIKSTVGERMQMNVNAGKILARLIGLLCSIAVVGLCSWIVTENLISLVANIEITVLIPTVILGAVAVMTAISVISQCVFLGSKS